MHPSSRQETAVLNGIRNLIDYVGDNSGRDGLEETPTRFLKAMVEMTDGYDVDIELLLSKTFDAGDSNEMIVVRNIEFVSLCEHHLLPFLGTATVAYLPADRVVGLSKIARLVDAFAHRLQIQERLTTQITSALDDNLKTLGSAVIIKAKHSCMGCRGVKKPNAEMITSSLTGGFREIDTRTEFLALAAL
jgi:GTP cyclohydrolase IA